MIEDVQAGAKLWGAPSGTIVSRHPIMLVWTDTCVTRSVPGGPGPAAPGREPHGVVVLAEPR